MHLQPRVHLPALRTGLGFRIPALAIPLRPQLGERTATRPDARPILQAYGAGKTITTRPIPGLDRPVPGPVTVNGMPLADWQAGYSRLT